jgi:quinol-cytochrome oxidoreductase complex cytochrome b subunit
VSIQRRPTGSRTGQPAGAGRRGLFTDRHAICLPTGVARASPPNDPRATRELIAGVVLGLLCAVVIVLLALFAFGYLVLPRSPIPTYPPVVTEPRPTPFWPFREEWLTPRPKA